MPALAPFWTAEMVRALPNDGNRYETVHGELLVTPSPRMLHQKVAMRLTEALLDYLKVEPVAVLFSVAADISWSEDTLVQPDLFAITLDEARTDDWAKVRTLLLVVEVLSPSSRRADHLTKRRLYQEQRIPLYWIIDADAQTVELWTPTAPTAVHATDHLEWHPAGAARPFTITLEALFPPI